MILWRGTGDLSFWGRVLLFFPGNFWLSYLTLTETTTPLESGKSREGPAVRALGQDERGRRVLETQNMGAEEEKYGKDRRPSYMNPSLTSPRFHSISPFRALNKDLVIKELRSLQMFFW